LVLMQSRSKRLKKRIEIRSLKSINWWESKKVIPDLVFPVNGI